MKSKNQPALPGGEGRGGGFQLATPSPESAPNPPGLDVPPAGAPLVHRRPQTPCLECGVSGRVKSHKTPSNNHIKPT